MAIGPRLLATGFGPFPHAPENPTEALMRALAREAPASFGAREFRAVVLAADYRRAWATLRRLYATFLPDVVVHFGLARKAKAILVERQARNSADPAKPDAAGYAPRVGLAHPSGPAILPATLQAEAIVSALQKAGFPARLSDDAGDYVCNAVFYRSLLAGGDRRVGFLHVPPEGVGGFTRDRLIAAAAIGLTTAVEARRAGARAAASARESNAAAGKY